MSPGRQTSRAVKVGLAGFTASVVIGCLGTSLAAGSGPSGPSGELAGQDATDPGSDTIDAADPIALSSAARLTPVIAHTYPVIAAGSTYEHGHHDYPATDIAAPCGSRVVSAVDGVVRDVERTDLWNPLVDLPSTRGGRTVVVDGDDDVRYLFAHFSSITSGLAVGQRVTVGQTIGTVGSSGRSTGCHLHLGLSPACPALVWDRLAGTVWPWPYLDAWREHDNIGPGPEVARWSATHADGCSSGAVVAPPEGVTDGAETGFGE